MHFLLLFCISFIEFVCSFTFLLTEFIKAFAIHSYELLQVFFQFKYVSFVIHTFTIFHPFRNFHLRTSKSFVTKKYSSVISYMANYSANSLVDCATCLQLIPALPIYFKMMFLSLFNIKIFLLLYNSRVINARVRYSNYKYSSCCIINEIYTFA